MRFGFHLSIAGGFKNVVKRAAETGSETIQIFSSNPRGWQAKELDLSEVQSFKEELKKAGIYPLIIHMPYLPNLASPKEEAYQRSCKILTREVKRAETLGAQFLVTHLGSALSDDKKKALLRVAEAINTASSKKVMLLLENTAGSGSEVGSNFREMGTIIKALKNPQRVGICLDTAHAFAAGYDLKTEAGLQKTLTEFDEAIGLNKLKLLHLNDALNLLGSKVDRHADIGTGSLGIEGMKKIINHPKLTHLPAIMETPHQLVEDGIDNLKVVKSLSGPPHKP